MILGVLTAVLFLLTAAKFVTKRLPFKRLDKFALKFHRVSGIALIVVSVVHIATVWGLLRQRPAGMLAVGVAIAVCALIAALSRAFKKRMGGKWLVVHRTASAIICIGLVIHIALGMTSFSAYQKTVALITYDNIGIGSVADGNYEAEYDVGYIYAKVSVAVKDGSIADIDLLEHRNERGKPAESITEAITAKQSLDVDAVSGATNSSKVIKKAIENALKKGVQ
jgi:uncharacterized protein with FMN-binding domain